MSEWKIYRLSSFAEINPPFPLKKGNEYSFVEVKDSDVIFEYMNPFVKKGLKGRAKLENGNTLTLKKQKMMGSHLTRKPNPLTATLLEQMQKANELDEAIVQNLRKIGIEIMPHKTVKT